MFSLGAAEGGLKLKQTAGTRKSEPACPVCARKQPWWRPWDGGCSHEMTWMLLLAYGSTWRSEALEIQQAF